jgi:hypothetical protein
MFRGKDAGTGKVATIKVVACSNCVNLGKEEIHLTNYLSQGMYKARTCDVNVACPMIVDAHALRTCLLFKVAPLPVEKK